MPRPRPFVRVRLAWLLSGLMLSVVAGEWEAARTQALEVLEILQRAIEARNPREGRHE